MGLDINLPLLPQVCWLLGINVSINRFDIGKIFEGSGINSETGSWTSLSVLTGLRLSGTVSPSVALHVFGQIGILVGYQPEIRLSEGSYRWTYNSAISSSFGFGFGAGATIDRAVLYIRYISGEPEYPLNEDKKYTQPTACVQICAGIAF